MRALRFAGDGAPSKDLCALDCCVSSPAAPGLILQGPARGLEMSGDWGLLPADAVLMRDRNAFVMNPASVGGGAAPMRLAMTLW